ncbi:hypothetical protein JL721_9090 [Aureococcus anophagefferens]|nr:hypothetical protein JL721_9090 [Aureococcus anophagefferens]
MEMESATLLASPSPAAVAREPVDVPNRPSRKLAAGLVGLGLLAGGVAAAFARRPVEATATELGSLKSAYCNLTISKQTFSVSDPATTGKWLRSYFPVECESDGGFTDYSLCEHSMGGCGSYVRLALNGTNEGEATPCFGIHMVNAAKRPAGDTDVATVEAHFNARLGTMGEYDAFMDFATVFVANSLDSYINDFERDGVAYMLLRWKDNSDVHTTDGGTTGRTFFSLIVHIPDSQINFEIVSAVAPEAKAQRPIFEDDMVRLPHSTISSAGASPPGEDYLIPVAISKGTSDIETISTYYTQILQADFDYLYSDETEGLTMNARLRRRDAHPLHPAHGHVELRYEVPVDTYTDLLTTAGNKWHCSRVGFGALDVYAVEPTGDAIQLDGYLTDAGTSTMMTYGCYNTSNVLFHLCSEGKCITKSAPVSHLEPGDDDPTKTDDLTVAATTTSSSEETA